MRPELRKIIMDYRNLNYSTLKELKKGTNETIDKIFKVFIKYMKKGNEE